jgi:hypothetical protein
LWCAAPKNKVQVIRHETIEENGGGMPSSGVSQKVCKHAYDMGVREQRLSASHTGGESCDNLADVRVSAETMAPLAHARVLPNRHISPCAQAEACGYIPTPHTDATC